MKKKLELKIMVIILTIFPYIGFKNKANKVAEEIKDYIR